MVDFIIVGQGLAGSVLALQLLKQGQRVLVIGNSQAPSASDVAAGLYNPMTGRHMVKTWLADTLFPYLTQFYQAAERTLGTSFLYPMPIFRPFVTPQERTMWKKKAGDYTDFIAAVAPSPPYSAYQYDGLVLQQAGYLDTRCFVQATRAYLDQQGAYREGAFVYDQLQLGEQVHYQGLTAQQIIFCEGAQALHNPFFKTLPFRLVKGELLSVALPQSLAMIYNRGVFVRPQPGRQALVGATYDKEDLSWNPTEKARQALEARLRQSFRLPYTVQDQWAGIRPATFDHRPLIGLHPQYPQIGIFNGLGSKGVSLAPYWAHIFVQHLLSHQALPPAVQLTRAGPAL
ncbi:MAG: FAD-dependent oxidoreductase [Bacteroidota bacterium]